MRSTRSRMRLRSFSRVCSKCDPIREFNVVPTDRAFSNRCGAGLHCEDCYICVTKVSRTPERDKAAEGSVRFGAVCGERSPAGRKRSLPGFGADEIGFGAKASEGTAGGLK